MPFRWKRLATLVLCATGLLLGAGAASAGLETGRAAFLAGDHATAYREFRAAGDAGNMQALHLAGEMLLTGRGVPKDVPAGLALLERAAAAGVVQAMVTAGTAYAYGDGVPPDYAKAYRLLEPAAQAGDPHAQNNVAVLYHLGLGTATDHVRAMSWALRAERQGLLQAINLRQEIESILTLAQKAEAVRLASAPLTAAAPVPEAAPILADPAGGSATLPPLVPVAPPVDTAPAPTPNTEPAQAPRPAQPPPPVPVAAAPEPAPSTGMPSAGGWAVQVAALQDRAEAERQWRAIAARQTSLLGGMDPTFAAADLGAKGVFIRVLVGDYPTRREAEAFCARLKQAGQDCLTRQR